MESIIIESESEMIAFGKQIGLSANPGDIFGLIGDLGAGKTHFTKGFVLGNHCDKPVTSPTFSLIHEYEGGSTPIFHFDLYRLESASELLEIGWEDYLEMGGICIVEWADKFTELMPEKIKWLKIELLDDQKRLIKELIGP